MHILCQFLIFKSGTDLTSLFILFFFFVGWPLQKSLRLRRFKSDHEEIWRECSSNKYTSIDGVGFSSWRHTFNMAAITSFHATKCCRLVSENEVSAGAYAAASLSSWSCTFVIFDLGGSLFICVPRAPCLKWLVAFTAVFFWCGDTDNIKSIITHIAKQIATDKTQ